MQLLQNVPANLDESDMLIIQELEQDPRATYKSIASKLNTSIPTVKRRLSRLISKGIITICARPNYEALGYQARLTLAINVPPGMVDKVVEQLVCVDSIEFLSVTAGHYDIIAIALYRDPEEFIKSFPEEIAAISEKLKIETMLNVHLVKITWGYPSQHDSDTISHPKISLSNLDLSIIRELQESPRASLKELSQKTGASLSSVRASFKKIISGRAVWIFTVRNPVVFGEAVMGITLIQAHPPNLNDVTRILEDHPLVKNVTLTIGAFNCMIWTSFESSDKMYDFLTQDLGCTSGIVQYESLLVLRIIKAHGIPGANIKMS